MSASTPPAPAHPRRWAILAVLSIAQLMVVLDATVVNIALPSAPARPASSPTAPASGSSPPTRSPSAACCCWAGRSATSSAASGRSSTGLLGFAAASAVGGAAQSFERARRRPRPAGRLRRAARPGRALAADDDVHRPAPTRARRSASSARIAGGGGAVGLLLGGILTEYLSWRCRVYVNLALRRPGRRRRDRARCAPRAASRPPALRRARRPDRLGRPVRARLRPLARGDDELEQPGHRRLPGRGRVLLGAFVAIAAPRARTRCCRCGSCSTARAAAPSWPFAISAAGIFGVFLFLTYYLQQTLGFSPVEHRPRLPADDRRAHGHRHARHGAPRARASARGRSCRRACCSPRSACSC